MIVNCDASEKNRIERAREGWSFYRAQRAQPAAVSGKSAVWKTAKNTPKTVATSCDRLPNGAHGKEEVDLRRPARWPSCRPPRSAATERHQPRTNEPALNPP